jgi:hypothetical protein
VRGLIGPSGIADVIAQADDSAATARMLKREDGIVRGFSDVLRRSVVFDCLRGKLASRSFRLTISRKN